MTRIIGIGHYLPKNKVSNEELAKKYGLDTSNEWIKKRTGILNRYFARSNESILDLAYFATEDLFKKRNVNRLDINTIIVATMSTHTPTPSLACQLQSKIGATSACAFDISAACSGFVYALAIADALANQKQSGYTLIVAAEKMQELLNFEDRSTCILFGDGAACMLLESDGQTSAILGQELHSDGDHGSNLTAGSLEYSDKSDKLIMNGRVIFNFVQKKVIPSIGSLINDLEITIEKVDYFLVHQANKRLLENISKELNIPSDKIPMNIDQVANISGASIPILLSQMVEEHKIMLNQQQTLLLTGFGGGLTWGNILIKI